MTDKKILTLIPNSPADEDTTDIFAETNSILEYGIDTYQHLALVGIDTEGAVKVSYSSTTPAQLLVYAEVLRKEALDLMYCDDLDE